jgi:hypothetical protein
MLTATALIHDAVLLRVSMGLSQSEGGRTSIVDPLGRKEHHCSPRTGPAVPGSDPLKHKHSRAIGVRLPP